MAINQTSESRWFRKWSQLSRCGAIAVALAVGAGCHRNAGKVETTEEPAKLTSVIQMRDPQAAQQLIRGFYGVESNAWRWTAGKFSVVLETPGGAATRGGKLTLKLVVPQPTIQQLKSVTLSAKVQETDLAPEKFMKTGDYSYERDVPASALGGETTRVDFSLDKAMPPSGPESRELGVIVSQVGLEPK